VVNTDIGKKITFELTPIEYEIDGRFLLDSSITVYINVESRGLSALKLSGLNDTKILFNPEIYLEKTDHRYRLSKASLMSLLRDEFGSEYSFSVLEEGELIFRSEAVVRKRVPLRVENAGVILLPSGWNWSEPLRTEVDSMGIVGPQHLLTQIEFLPVYLKEASARGEFKQVVNLESSFESVRIESPRVAVLGLADQWTDIHLTEEFTLKGQKVKLNLWLVGPKTLLLNAKAFLTINVLESKQLDPKSNDSRIEILGFSPNKFSNFK
jgi:hypothetical protein